MIHDKIKSLRIARQFTQFQIAEKLHMSQNAYSRLENGKCSINFSRVVELAFCFEVDPAEILNECQNDPSKTGQNYLTDDVKLLLKEKDDMTEFLKQVIIAKDTQLDRLLDQVHELQIKLHEKSAKNQITDDPANLGYQNLK